MDNAAQSIPSIDPNAPLKIEEQSNDEVPTVDYGGKLFFVGIVFCVLIVICVALVSFFWTRSVNQTQQVITIQQSH